MTTQVVSKSFINTLESIKEKQKCRCSSLDTNVLLTRLYEILESLQEEMIKKDQQIQTVKEQHEQRQKVKDQIIKRLVQANQNLSEENTALMGQIKKKQKTQTFVEKGLALQQFDQSKRNICDLLTVDNSFRNKAQISNSSSLVKPVSKTIRKSYKHIRSCINLKFQQGVSTLKKRGTQFEDRLRSSAFINKRVYNWLDHLPQREKSHKNSGVYKIQVSMPGTYKRLGSPMTTFRHIY